MGHYVAHPLEWQEPLGFCHSRILPDKSCVLLYSGLRTSYSGRYSFFATDELAHVAGSDFSSVSNAISDSASTFDNAWFGYISYEMAHALERVSRSKPTMIAVAPIWFAQFGRIYCFDHESKTLTEYRHPSLPDENIAHELTTNDNILFTVSKISSNMTKSEYLDHVATIKRAILAGDCYQANLTRKFFGKFDKSLDTFDLFIRLCGISPAPYSAYIQTPECTILSSSPEKFLTITADGRIVTRPIKGTARRFSDAQQDMDSRLRLETSEKDKSENLMIVDLMRNDLSRCSEPGSVTVSNLFQVESFATVHHMDSTITSRKRKNLSALDVVKSCFPPGSMTGAPKIKAMEWCSRLEEMQRGIYSGAIGWFGGDGSCDLSVVIRTLIIKGKQFEFQVGGGIVADSAPESEWEETITKARGMLHALGVDESALREI
jgi:para-aminobenzoate synthetase component 1